MWWKKYMVLSNRAVSEFPTERNEIKKKRALEKSEQYYKREARCAEPVNERSEWASGCIVRYESKVSEARFSRLSSIYYVIDTPPFLPINFFRHRTFSERQYRSVAPRNVWVLWDKTISTEKREPPSFIPNIFRYPKLMNHWTTSQRNFSALWNKKFSTGNRDTPVPLIPKFFRYQKFFETEGTPYEVFWSYDAKNFRQNHVTHVPIICMKIFDTRLFWKTETVSYEDFRHCERKISTQKCDFALSCKKLFRSPKNSDTLNCSPRLFGTVRQNFCTKSHDTPFFSQNLEIIGGIVVCRKPSRTRF